MKRFALWLLMLCLAGCDAHEPAPTPTTRVPDCTIITSDVKRLACFDTVAGTPGQIPSPPASTPEMPELPAATQDTPLIVALVRHNESQRVAEDTQFLLSRASEGAPGESQFVISAPALGSDTPRPLMSISCLSGITRLQLLVTQAMPGNRLRMRLLMDGRPIADATNWQVLEGGTIADAGRGLVAIDVLKRLGEGSRLQTESDYAPLDGLMFDARGLHALIEQQREACRW